MLLTAVGGLRPDPGPARTWLERELSRPEYQQGLLERLGGWLRELWEGLRLSALDASPLSSGAVVVVAVVLVALLVLGVSRVRREAFSSVEGNGLLVAGEASADEHRRDAEEALAAGAFERVIVSSFRAVAVRAVRRGLIDGSPGLTAHELAVGLTPVFPAQAADLAHASLLFDLVFYGERPASERDARSLLALDDELRAARPARSATAAVP